VVHGGAGSAAAPDDEPSYRDAIANALLCGVAELAAGARAAVLAAVGYMEESTPLNAGVGAVLADDGTVRLDAGFMDGATLRFGAVADVQRCPTPVHIAAHLASDGRYGRMLVGAAAERAAAEAGIALCDPERLITARARERHRRSLADSTAPTSDTVGAVAVDASGHLAAAVSTGGLAGKRAGRVGDSPIVGAGFWADDRHGAAAATGIGEVLMRQGTSRRCVELLGRGAAAAEAVRVALAELHDDASSRRDGLGGLIVMTPDGELAIGHDTAAMSAGWIRPGGPPTVALRWR
jgi:beta-aspartyl-peptidase (threonine type)